MAHSRAPPPPPARSPGPVAEPCGRPPPSPSSHCAAVPLKRRESLFFIPIKGENSNILSVEGSPGLPPWLQIRPLSTEPDRWAFSAHLLKKTLLSLSVVQDQANFNTSEEAFKGPSTRTFKCANYTCARRAANEPLSQAAVPAEPPRPQGSAFLVLGAAAGRRGATRAHRALEARDRVRPACEG